MAANSLWCFLVPLVVVICTASAASINSEEEFVNPIPLTRATDVERTPKCPSKERWDKCGALCQRNCTNFNDHPGVCPLPCVSGCVCQPGYVRGANGRCIKSRECPGSKKCPRGERYDDCSYLCQKNCTNYHSNEPCTYSCHPGCVCPEGYVRSVFPSGKCIKVDKCPKSAEEDIFHENTDDSEDIDDTDDKDGVMQIRTGCPDEDLCSRWCRAQGKKDGKCTGRFDHICSCRSGYGLDDENSDDSEDIEDTEGSFCPSNEEFVKCEAKYEPDCGNSPISKSLCVSGCRCKSGYVRGPRRTCIKKEECPEKDNTVYPVQRICPRHEYWNKYTAHCQKNCSHPRMPACPTIAVAGCICKRGFLRREDGKCVPQKRCPKTEESGQDWTDDSAQVWTDESVQDWEDQQPRPKSFCPKNERFAACLGHCEPNCRNKTSGYADCDKGVCVSECTCLYGFVRGPKGTCIKSEECPKKDNTKYPVKRVCPEKEHWDASNAHCQKNCTNLDTLIPCTKQAVAGCVCDKGLYRNKAGQCVPRNQCSGDKPDDKTFCPPNELFITCFGHCEPDCKTKTIQNCDRSVCVSACKCQYGFVRGPKGECIKPEKCPANDKTKYPVKRKCPTTEQWEPTKAHCQTNCTTLGKKIPCHKKAVGGCICKKDTYRAKNGQCVPKKQCPKKADEFDVSTEDDFDAEYSTEEPSWLHRTDDDHDEKSWNDNDDDAENGDEDDARASSYCPPNEFFASCIGHCEPDCKDKTKTLQDCNKSICVSECKCKWGFVRGPKGDCIKPDKCPANDKTKYPVKRKCPAKEQWETSRAHCQTNCTTIGKTIPCTKIAVAGCVCKKDTYRAKNGECVPKKQCSKKAEEFDVSTEDDFEAEFSTEDPSLLHRTDDDDSIENRDGDNARDEVLEGPGGCPSDRKCSQYCRGQGKKYGRCVGRHRRMCTCRS